MGRGPFPGGLLGEGGLMEQPGFPVRAAPGVGVGWGDRPAQQLPRLGPRQNCHQAETFGKACDGWALGVRPWQICPLTWFTRGGKMCISEAVGMDFKEFHIRELRVALRELCQGLEYPFSSMQAPGHE